jgi:hypothetical protein
MNKIWANRVQKEVENFKEKPPFGVKLDDRTFFDESDGKCVVYCHCCASDKISIINNNETAAAAADQQDQEEEIVCFVLEIDISEDTRYPFEVPTVKVVEGANSFPQGAIQEGTNILNPLEDIWTPSHTVLYKK